MAMRRGYFRGFTTAEETELWDHWQRGDRDRGRRLGKHVRKLTSELRRSLTRDHGKEMADHKSFTMATKVQVYFCDPRSPWQRGSNENTNGLLRQYFPRGTDLSRFSQDYLNKIALRLNQRPRETLGFETPADRLRAVLQ